MSRTGTLISLLKHIQHVRKAEESIYTGAIRLVNKKSVMDINRYYTVDGIITDMQYCSRFGFLQHGWFVFTNADGCNYMLYEKGRIVLEVNNTQIKYTKECEIRVRYMRDNRQIHIALLILGESVWITIDERIWYISHSLTNTHNMISIVNHQHHRVCVSLWDALLEVLTYTNYYRDLTFDWMWNCPLSCGRQVYICPADG